MRIVNSKELECPSPPFRLRWNAVLKDLRLFASLWLAWLMVWKELRRERKERAARLKRIRIVREDLTKGEVKRNA